MTVLIVIGIFGDGKNGDTTQLKWKDVGMVWAYDLACLVFLDVVKVFYNHTCEGTVETIDVDTPREQILRSPQSTMGSRMRSTAQSSLLSSISRSSARVSGHTPALFPRRRNLATGRTFMHQQPASLASKAAATRARVSAF